jgi:pimeloyl-ACP methyl ester carboxylesterase
MPRAAAVTHVCRYDRAGLGESEPGPRPRTSKPIVAELHTLLVKARVPRPYVLVGHSLAGLNIHLYVSTYADDVVGLVFVDAIHLEVVSIAIENVVRAAQR